MKGNQLATLQSSAKIDRRFAARHPARKVWLRPATPAERKLFQAQSGESVPDGLSLCLVIVRRDPDFLCVPFASTTPDVASATEAGAATVAAAALQAYHEGTIAMICPRESVKC